MGTPRPAITPHPEEDIPGPLSATGEAHGAGSLPHPDQASSQRKAASRFSKIYAAISDTNLSPFQRVTYTRTTVVLGFAAGFLLSSKLWISTRYYPLVPIVHGLPPLRFPLDYICAGMLFLLTWSIGFASRPRPYIVGFAALLLFLALYDQNRWQPWVYLYLFMLLSLACFSWNSDDLRGQEDTLNMCRLIVGANYFYSGLQKMNPHFANVGVISLLGPRGGHLPLLHVWPWVMAAIEASIGIGLLTRKYRNLAVVCGIFMHLFILFSCVVILHWNSVVWPWNVTMIALLILLFWKAEFSFIDVIWRNPMPLQKVVLVLFVVMPFLSFFGWWDSYLSSSLYSANVAEANVLFRGPVKSQLPMPLRRYVKELPAATDILNIRDWSIGELNVPPYPALRVYRAIGAEMCKYSHNSPEVVLIMRDRDTLFGRARQSQDTCLGTLIVNKW